MDEKKEKEIGYELAKCCGNCVYHQYECDGTLYCYFHKEEVLAEAVCSKFEYED